MTKEKAAELRKMLDDADPNDPWAVATPFAVGLFLLMQERGAFDRPTFQPRCVYSPRAGVTRYIYS